MMSFVIISIYVCSICGVGSVVLIVRRFVSDRVGERHKKLIGAKYVESVSKMLNRQETVNIRLPKVDTRRAKSTLITILTKVGKSCTGYNKRVIERLIDVYDLDKVLARRVRLTGGKRKALAIQAASKLPLCSSEHNKFDCYATHRNRYVRFSSLLYNIARQPEMTPQLLDLHKHKLNDLELGQVVNTIASTQFPLSWISHLLRSYNANLQFVGLELALLYQAPELMQDIAQLLTSRDRSISRKALNTLIKLHVDLNDSEVAQAVTSFRTHSRKSIYRLCIAEGYSTRAFDTINQLEEDSSLKRYIGSAIRSHKRNLSPQVKNSTPLS